MFHQISNTLLENKYIDLYLIVFNIIIIINMTKMQLTQKS